jgi:hypothetical protein
VKEFLDIVEGAAESESATGKGRARNS